MLPIFSGHNGNPASNLTLESPLVSRDEVSGFSVYFAEHTMYKENGPLPANSASLLLVAVLLGSPLLAQTTSFTRTDYQVGSFPSSIATGDLNGDGYLDLVVANGGDNAVSVLFGNPDVTFQPAIQLAAGSGPVSVVIADFNGDGNLDIATANAGVSEPTKSVSVLLGDGNGNFGSPITSPTGTYPMAMAMGDVNNDGIPDLVLA